jgi:crotonobetainyl-CoA:carnitine CoA-transferase CaiB-like acyl-CoA transferase
VPTPDSRRTTAGGNTGRLRERLREEFADYDRDDQVESRRLLTDSYNLGRDAPVRTAGAPFETAAGRPSLDDCPPEVGEHTREVLSEHGYSAEETWRLIDDDVVVAAEADD